jgi:hypothetical protein
MTAEKNKVLSDVYKSDLKGFNQTYQALNDIGILPQRQQQWLDAAAEATHRLNLSSKQVKAVLRLPVSTPANDVGAIAALPNGAESFYRMSLLGVVAEHLSEGLGGDTQARRWMKINHLSGPYEAKRPLSVVMNGEPHELKTLRSYLRHNL